MEKYIQIKNAKANNLKNISIAIPLNKLVAIVGKSGSGKSSLAYDILYKFSQGEEVEANISGLPKVHIITQKVIPIKGLSLGQTNLKHLKDIVKRIKPGELLIADEPCAGFIHHERQEIFRILKSLVKKGISMIVVEHNKDIIANADYVVEFGPESGSKGGRIIFEGDIDKFRKSKTPTSMYAFTDLAEKVNYKRIPNDRAKRMQKNFLTLKGITKNNLKNFNISFPLGSLVCLTGKSGSGKSTLLSIVYGALFKGKDAWRVRTGFKGIEGKTNVRRSYLVDQSSLSSNSTSTPATLLGVWDSIRSVYANLVESKSKKLKKSHFSFNTSDGRKKTEVLKKIKYKNRSIYDLLRMTVDDSMDIFEDLPLVKRKLGFLHEVGLGYLTLGQKSNTLSGGEAQRVKLAKILSKKLGDRCIYILDTPSRGLHLSDLPILVKVLQKIIDKNNTVIMAENREELINNSDFVIRI